MSNLINTKVNNVMGKILTVEYSYGDVDHVAVEVEHDGAILVLKWLNKRDIAGLYPGNLIRFSGRIVKINKIPTILYPEYNLIVN